MKNQQFTQQELQRYSRHLLLSEVGLEGQQKLKQAKVLIIGTGGLGCPVALYLAAAGVGQIGLVEYDTIDISNLQRQILYSSHDVGRSKLDVAKSKIEALNDNIKVLIHNTKLDDTNVFSIFSIYDIIVDATDNFETRYLSNDATFFLGKPLVYASIFRFEGQVSVFNRNDNSPCYRCLYQQPPQPGLVPNCAEGGVLGVLPGVIGTLQASEVIKIILNKGALLDGKLLLVDVLETDFQVLEVLKHPACALCGDNPAITELEDYIEFCGINLLEKTSTIPSKSAMDLVELSNSRSLFQLIDVRTNNERAINRIDNSIHIPQSQLMDRLHHIDAEVPVIIHCKSGKRSAKIVETLLELGYSNIFNLDGGIDAYYEYQDSKF